MTNAVTTKKSWSPSQLALIKRTVAKDATDDELSMFAHVAKKAGLDPFLKEIWFVKYKGGETLMMAGRDGFLSIAQKSGQFAGIQSAAVYEKDKLEIDFSTSNVKHVITEMNRGILVGAWAKVYRKDCEPNLTYIQYNQYVKGSPIWKQYPDAMIVKCAESIALKKLFGISGIVSMEEMGFEPVTEAKKVEKPTQSFDDLYDMIVKSDDPATYASALLTNPPFALTPEQVAKLNALCKSPTPSTESGKPTKTTGTSSTS